MGSNKKRKGLVSLIISSVGLFVSGFVFICAANAHSAFLGRSVLTIGKLFFEKNVVSLNIKPIIISEICAGVIALICLAICIYSVVKLIQNHAR